MILKTLLKPFFVLIAIFSLNTEAPGQSDFITVNGTRLEVQVAGIENMGMGTPTIVFENGRASKFDSWQTVIEEVSRKSVVFAYNRPRIGRSEDDSLPPTMRHIVENLREMLLKKTYNHLISW